MEVTLKNNVGLTHIPKSNWCKELRFFNAILFSCLLDDSIDGLFSQLQILFADRKHQIITKQVKQVFDWGMNDAEDCITIYQVNTGTYVPLIEVK